MYFLICKLKLDNFYSVYRQNEQFYMGNNKKCNFNWLFCLFRLAPNLLTDQSNVLYDSQGVQCSFLVLSCPLAFLAATPICLTQILFLVLILIWVFSSIGAFLPFVLLAILSFCLQCFDPAGEKLSGLLAFELNCYSCFGIGCFVYTVRHHCMSPVSPIFHIV